MDIEQLGFKLYVAGYPGTGRTTAVKDFLEQMAKTKQVPSDWCYVNNFEIRMPDPMWKTLLTSSSLVRALKVVPFSDLSRKHVNGRSFG